MDTNTSLLMRPYSVRLLWDMAAPSGCLVLGSAKSTRIRPYPFHPSAPPLGPVPLQGEFILDDNSMQRIHCDPLLNLILILEEDLHGHLAVFDMRCRCSNSYNLVKDFFHFMESGR